MSYNLDPTPFGGGDATKSEEDFPSRLLVLWVCVCASDCGSGDFSGAGLLAVVTRELAAGEGASTC
jgi:hypothetical protein